VCCTRSGFKSSFVLNKSDRNSLAASRYEYDIENDNDGSSLGSSVCCEVGESLGVPDGVSLFAIDGFVVGDSVTKSFVGSFVGFLLGEELKVVEGEFDGRELRILDGAELDLFDGIELGIFDGEELGLFDVNTAVGLLERLSVGESLGLVDKLEVGLPLGLEDGVPDGLPEGESDDLTLGASEGDVLGTLDGFFEGEEESVLDGSALGMGDFVGGSVKREHVSPVGGVISVKLSHPIESPGLKGTTSQRLLYFKMKPFVRPRPNWFLPFTSTCSPPGRSAIGS